MNSNILFLNAKGTMAKLLLCVVMFAGLAATPIWAADGPGVGEQAREAVNNAGKAVEGAAKDAKEAVQDAGKSVSNSFEELWARVDKNRLKNRTPSEIAAWVVMGVLVGAVAGMMTNFKSSGLGNLGRLLFGLTGAFIGGLIVHVGKLDFGMGFVLLRYEELLFSFVGAIVLVIVGRFFCSRAKKTPSVR